MNANLCRHLVSAAQAQPQGLAVAVQRHRFGKPPRGIGELCYDELTLSELNRRSDAIAHGLNAIGLNAGDKAVLMVTPGLDFFALTFALFKAGIIPVMVDPGMGIKNLGQCFDEAAPDAFIGIPKAHVARMLFSWGKKTVTQLVTVGRGLKLWGGNTLAQIEKRGQDMGPYPMALLDEQALCAILFTSGSTGIPKGVEYSHQMFEAQIQALKQDYGIRHGERDLSTFPLFALFGPALGMASIVPCMDASRPIKAKPEYLFKAIADYQCTNLFLNPALLDKLGRYGEANALTLNGVRRVISAGAPASIDAISRFRQILPPDAPVLNSYGATEGLPLCFVASDELLASGEVTAKGGGILVGKPVQGVALEIIAIDEAPIAEWQDELKLQPYEIGEIVVKGPMVSRAYYHRDEATSVAKIADGEGMWHRMGDLGYLDELGRLWMCGRKAHRVDATEGGAFRKHYFSIPCERIFNIHPLVARSALVGVHRHGDKIPLVCLELERSQACNNASSLYRELREMAEAHEITQGIDFFLIHESFPMDVRHNAKIFREKLALWAEKQLSGGLNK
ncbi:olefin beta-lactone synthetase [Shewanella zhangzhouensis]|uniref:olefin beta-lactone synthetase n=1 Tax=Shewanella zhangzhouensis TaxID=2864213 RepID=UPI001C661F3A|nr:fatty acid CoA ligase family protein [Shewanella zhangzhouensis]QYK06448.1 AMP-binding protein [Shewanella zhangzhouensis]